MKVLLRIIRLLHINFVLARHGLDELVLSLHLFRPLRFLIFFNPWNWFRDHKKNRGQRIKLALIELGPIFIKFGQTLSTRRDILPEDIADELATLQDRVPSFPSEKAQEILEKSYGKPLNEVFQHFELQPLASASIAQAHVATLFEGDEVVIKVLRPKIKKLIQRDIDLLYTIAKFAEKYWSEATRLRPVEVVKEFETTLMDELDLLREAASASQLRRNFSDSDMLYIPKVHWKYCKKNILVTERIYGIPISDIESLREHEIDFKRLAEIGVEIFFTQVFRDCFFHADMHPGNIFVSPHHKKEPRYLGVDFGIMGSLSPFDQRYLAENFLAFFRRDYRRVAELHVESGWVSQDTRIDQFEAAIRTVCEPIFERPLSEISCAQMLLRLFQTARRFNMEVQPQLILLQKTLFNVEGLGRQLYPDLDLWNTAKPYLEKWLRDRYSNRTVWKKIKENMPIWFEKLPEMPELVYEALSMSQQRVSDNAAEFEALDRKPTKRITSFIFGLLSGGIIASLSLHLWLKTF